MTHVAVFEDLADLASRVQDGMSVGIGGTLFTRMPVALLAAVCARRPRDLHYLSWGGGLPLEMLLEANAVSRATLCFSSLDIFGQAPRFRKAVEDGALPLVEISAHAFHQGLWAGRRRLPSEPMVWPAGSDLPTLPGFPPAGVDPITGDRIANVAAIRPDVLLLHAQAADAEGNIEIYGARGVDPTVVCAAREVLVTVEEVVDRGSLGTRPHSVVLPKHLITAIAVVPGGSGPTSCLPYRCADYGAIARWIAQPSLLASVPGGQTATTLDHIGVQEASEALEVVGHDGEPSLDEWMTCWLANQYDNDSICSVGAVSPLASASYLLAKATHAPDLTLITNGGGYIDVESRPLLLGLGEWLDACSAVTHAGGDETYELYYQPGLVTHEVVSVAQIDGEGRTNNREVTSPSGRRVRLPGQGGMADVSNMHRDFMIYLPRQSPLNTPQRVDFSTAARGLLSDAERMSAGLQPGRVRLVTNLAVFELTAEQPSFAIKEVFPWTTYEELAAATGFALDVPDLAGIPVVAGPTPQQLHALRSEVDPMGIRRLEFVPSRDRTPLLDEILAADARLMATLVVGGSDA